MEFMFQDLSIESRLCTYVLHNKTVNKVSHRSFQFELGMEMIGSSCFIKVQVQQIKTYNVLGIISSALFIPRKVLSKDAIELNSKRKLESKL